MINPRCRQSGLRNPTSQERQNCEATGGSVTLNPDTEAIFTAAVTQ
jgi:hypothetical protein